MRQQEDANNLFTMPVSAASTTHPLEVLPVVEQASPLPPGRPALETNASRATARTGETPAPLPRENFARRRVRLEIAPGQTGEGWLLVPEGRGPFPAVLVLYYERETGIGLGKEPLRDFGLQLAQRGFVTISIGTPGGNAWKPELGSARCQPLSYHAYVAANCWQALAGLEPLARGESIARLDRPCRSDQPPGAHPHCGVQ